MNSMIRVVTFGFFEGTFAVGNVGMLSSLLVSSAGTQPSYPTTVSAIFQRHVRIRCKLSSKENEDLYLRQYSYLHRIRLLQICDSMSPREMVAWIAIPM